MELTTARIRSVWLLANQQVAISHREAAIDFYKMAQKKE
jgi:hypothetical protein